MSFAERPRLGAALTLAVALAVALPLVAAVPGCADPARVIVHVAAPTPAPSSPIVQLHVTVTLGGEQDDFLAPDPSTAELPLPTDLVITLRRGDAGTLTLLIEGLDAGNGLVATGTSTVEVAPGEISETGDIALTAL